MLSVRGLSKRFGQVWALRDATFDIGAGEVLGLLGPSGAGKSTVFRCLAGLLHADAGAVFAGDREIDLGERASRLLFLPDGITPWGDQRVEWALDFAADAFGATQRWREEIGDVLRLTELLSRRLGELSRG